MITAVLPLVVHGQLVGAWPYVLVGAVAAFGAGWWLSGWGRRVCYSTSRWLHSGVVGFVAAVLAGAAVNLSGTWWEIASFWLLGVACGVLICCDLAVLRLPDPIMVLAYPVFLGALLIAAAGTGQWPRFGRALLAGLVLLVFYLINALVFPSGIYLGDVKFAGLLGAWLGWFGWVHLVWGTLLAAILGGVLGLGVIISRRGDRKTEYPYGPMMALGAWIAAVWLL
ncbi:leader peptidase (prepilin peptidase) / N-methyltransferase [Raineyella antarctica]|uniref:Leader peptidase (Prepilin peptidase) / N-methyltransferase n=1 Tax=Raineyella antarctica TaxID=1577474 RepID=A0A1G6GYQ5_9ACTN|nr:A24 family peptidase [Raineyella antarctica]SDB87013.1 leader peptidase (prepilin peptidase) / N-methyltransferase [Raineyella antarctica]